MAETYVITSDKHKQILVQYTQIIVTTIIQEVKVERTVYWRCGRGTFSMLGA